MKVLRSPPPPPPPHLESVARTDSRQEKRDYKGLLGLLPPSVSLLIFPRLCLQASEDPPFPLPFRKKGERSFSPVSSFSAADTMLKNRTARCQTQKHGNLASSRRLARRRAGISLTPPTLAPFSHKKGASSSRLLLLFFSLSIPSPPSKGG